MFRFTLIINLKNFLALLNEFHEHKKQIEELKKETDSMEAELNDLLLKFEAEKIKFQGCNKP